MLSFIENVFCDSEAKQAIQKQNINCYYDDAVEGVLLRLISPKQAKMQLATMTALWLVFYENK